MSITAGQVSVSGGTATLILAADVRSGATSGVVRKGVTILNFAGPSTVYIDGSTATIASGTSFPLVPNASWTFDQETWGTVYGLVPSGTADVRVIYESGVGE